MTKNLQIHNSTAEFLVYQTDDGHVKLDVRLENETIWLTQQMMADLFQTTQQNISQHIRNIIEEGELFATATHKKYLSVQQEGSRQIQRERDFFNLDMIIEEAAKQIEGKKEDAELGIENYE